MGTYTVQEYYDAIDSFAPFSLAEGWDNSGLLIGSGRLPVSRSVIALDATASVIREAKELDAQLIITHHPIIFKGPLTIAAESPVYAAISAGLSVICAHTSLDIARGGVNDTLAGLLRLKNTSILENIRSQPLRKVITFVPRQSAQEVYDAMAAAGAGRQGCYAGAAFLSGGEGRFVPLDGANPAVGEIGVPASVDELRIEMPVCPDRLDAVLSALRQAHPYEQPAIDVLETHSDYQREGIGRIGDIESEKALTPDAFALIVRQKLDCGGVRYVAGKEKITRVAVCGGAGAKLMLRAKELGAQAMVTSDTRHDELIAARNMGFTLIDAGHHATEAVILPVLRKKLCEALPKADIIASTTCTDPARYI